MKEEIIAGIDLGGSKVTCLIAKIASGNGNSEPVRTENIVPELIGEAIIEESSLNNGLIVDLEHMASVIRTATTEAEKKAGVKLSEIYVGIGGGHIRGETARGVIPISRAEKEVTGKTVTEVIEQAKAIKSSPGREIIYTVPQKFIIDEETGIKNPIGMVGNRLEAEIYIISGSTMGVQNIYKSVERANLGVRGLVLQSIAGFYAVLEPEDHELGYMLIDIGEENTEGVIFSDGNVKEIFNLEIGGKHITNDVAIGLGIPKKEAEILKEKYGFARSEIAPDDSIKILKTVNNEKTNTAAPNERTIERKALVGIIAPRVEEILALINRKMKDTFTENEYLDYMPAGIVIAGGTANIKGIDGLAERIFGMPARIGWPNTVEGLTDSLRDPACASAVGLIIYGMRHKNGTPSTQKMGKIEKEPWMKATTQKIRKFLLE